MADKESSLRKQLEYQERLNRITNRIHLTMDTREILLHLQDDILSLFDAERITVYVVERGQRQIVSLIKSGDEISEIRLAIDKDSIAGFCAVTGKVVEVVDPYDENELEGIHPSIGFDKSWDKKTGYRTRQVLAAPIPYDKYLMGVIQLINKKTGNRFTKEDRSSVQDIAKVLGAAFFKNEKLEQRAKATRFDFLITKGVISSKDLSDAISRARILKKGVEKVLMTDFQVHRDDIGESLSRHFKTPFVPYRDDMSIPIELLRGLRPDYLRSAGFVPVAKENKKVIVVMEAPDYLPVRDSIKRIIPAREYEFRVSLREDISKMIDLFFGPKNLDRFRDPGSIEDILGKLEPDEEAVDEEVGGMTEEDSAMVRLVNKMIMDAHKRGASDIHVEPRQGKGDVVIRFRIDGTCQIYQTIPNAYKKAIVSRVKIMSDLDISERRLPQDGKIKFKRFAPLDIELRVATMPTAGQNEDLVMRILTAAKPIALGEMGMTERDYKSFMDMISMPYGIVLVVGPTGSGKTTTLHAALGCINRSETKIWTAEDPVEITQEGLRQVQVQPKIGLDFARAMRSFLRADPDVIMVGEMRDRETMATGIEASLTGHLVLSTLHTNSAAETITRLLDMGMDPFNFADALLGVLAQRLVRTLCNACKVKYHPSGNELDTLARYYGGSFHTSGLKIDADSVLYRANGCLKCGNTGYSGRTAIHELLLGTDQIKYMIQNRATMKEIRDQAMKEGMTTLMQDGIRKVRLGLTDFAQVRRVCIR